MRNTLYLLLLGSVINIAVAGIYNAEYNTKNKPEDNVKDVNENVPAEVPNEEDRSNEVYKFVEKLSNIQEMNGIADPAPVEDLTTDDVSGTDEDQSKLAATKELEIDQYNDSNDEENNENENNYDLIDDDGDEQRKLRMKRFAFGCPIGYTRRFIGAGRTCSPNFKLIPRARRPVRRRL